MAMRVFYYWWQRDGEITMNVFPDSCPAHQFRKAPITVVRVDDGQMHIRLTKTGARAVGDAATLAQRLNECWGQFNRWSSSRTHGVDWVVSEGSSIPNDRFVLMAQFAYRCAVE